MKKYEGNMLECIFPILWVVGLEKIPSFSLYIGRGNWKISELSPPCRTCGTWKNSEVPLYLNYGTWKKFREKFGGKTPMKWKMIFICLLNCREIERWESFSCINSPNICLNIYSPFQVLLSNFARPKYVPQFVFGHMMRSHHFLKAILWENYGIIFHIKNYPFWTFNRSSSG